MQRPQIALGSAGFFAVRDEAANQIIDDGIEAAKAAGATTGVTRIGADDDATSLENMKAALVFIRECNELRVSEGLDPLRVTDRMMALSQTHANMSAELMNHWSYDNRKYNVGENLAWGSDDPFDGWYTREKEIYENGGDGVVGHYENIIGGYDITGFAINTVNGTMFIQDFSCEISKYYMNSYPEQIVRLRSGTPYSIDEYESAFMEYYNRVMMNLSSAEAELAAAQARLDDLKNSSDLSVIEAAEETVAQAEAKLEQAKADADEADALAAEKEAVMKESERLVEEAASNTFKAESDVKDCENQIIAAQNILNDALNAYDSTLKAVEELSSMLSEAEKEISDKQAAVDEANSAKDDLIKTVEDAERVVSEKKTAVDEAEKELAQAKADEIVRKKVLDEKRETLDEKKAALEAAKEILEEKKELLEAAVASYTDKATVLNHLKTRYQAVLDANDKLSEAISRFEEAMENLEEARVNMNDLHNAYNEAKTASQAAEGKYERALNLVYKGTDSEMISDPDFEYLNEYVETLRAAKKALEDALAVAAKADESKENAGGALENAESVLADAIKAYEDALNRFNEYTMLHAPNEETADNESGQSSIAGGRITDGAYDPELYDGKAAATPNTADHTSTPYMAYFLTSSLILAGYAIIRLKRNEEME